MSVIDDVIEEVGQMLFRRSYKECKDKLLCICCGGEAKQFVDEEAQKRYDAACLCQTCQEGVDSQ